MGPQVNLDAPGTGCPSQHQVKWQAGRTRGRNLKALGRRGMLESRLENDHILSDARTPLRAW
jgi:hypothetical protein